MPGRPVAFGGALRAHRVAAGLSQHELARRTGLSVRTLRDLEHDRVRRPRLPSVDRLIAALNLSQADAGHLRATLDGPDGGPNLNILVLGPLAVHRDGAPVDIAAAKLRTLLGLLAVQANREVSIEEIADLLWTGRPPRTWLDLVHTYVARLRARLHQPGRERVIARSGVGYLLDADRCQVDLVRFNDLAARARRAPQPQDAFELFARALDCWRGPVLADHDPRLRQHPTVVAAAQRRLDAAIAFADLAFDLDRHEHAVGALEVLASAEPLHEGLHARLVLALAGSGRRAAALELYAAISRRLADDLGVRPGPELAAAHRRVLRDDPPSSHDGAGAAWSWRGRITVDRPPTVPRQVPAAVGHFVGRTAELAALTRPAAGARGTGGTMVIGQAASGGSAVDIRLLGPVELRMADRVVDVGPVRHRAVLAALAADAGRLVTMATLVDRVWDEPPAGARAALYSYVSRLRRLLGVDDRPREAAGGSPVRLVRRPGGYLLEVDPDRVDLHRFRRLVAAAADRSDRERAALLSAAVRLWFGTPLAELPGEWAARMRAGWQQERLDAAVDWASVELRLGRVAEVIGPVRELAGEYPLSEPLVEVLMRALVAAGRNAEALECYVAARARLAGELGVEAGPHLRAVHQAILRGELDRPPAEGPRKPPAPAPGAPAQLPADVAAFTGRVVELDGLDRLATTADRTVEAPTALVISVVSGTGGVGKTALAVRWAHRVRESFPDGQLYVNLRGYDPLQPVAPGDALTRFLNALGVKGPDIPLDEEERAARYRTAIAGRRMLILLDNASTAEQVRPLLPGTASAVVVVTSRDSLAGLVAGHGAGRLDLDRLPIADAVALLRRLLGARVDTEPEATRSLAEQCVRLPLALRVAADLVATRPVMTLASLVAELADTRRRMDLLDAGGDARVAVRAVFSWSYRHLLPEAARAFRLLGLHPGPDIDAYATAALLETDLRGADRLLDVLARAHLTEATTPGRHSMHDLLRAYATELAATHDGESDRRAALTRLFDHYLATAATAMDTLFPADSDRRPRVPLSGSPAPPLDAPSAALAWLDTHRATLHAVCAHTVAHGWPHHTTRLAHTLHLYHANGGHYTHLLTMHTQALTAAGQVGDRSAEAHALSSLASANAWLSRYRRAVELLTQALTIFRDLGDRYGEARALGNLGVTRYHLGEYGPAAECYRRALALFRDVGDRVGEARALGNLGDLYLQQGRYELAVNLGQQALALHRSIGDRPGEAVTLGNLGAAYARQGRYEAAIDHQRRALVLSRQLANRNSQAEALTALGDVHTTLGRYQAAVDYHQQAFAIFEEIGSRDGQARALNGLGEASRAAGRQRDAITHHTAALELAVAGGDREPQARAHTGLAHAHRSLGDPDLSRRHWHQALDLYAGLGSPRPTTPKRS